MMFRIALCLLSVLMCAEVAMGQSAPAEKTGVLLVHYGTRNDASRKATIDALDSMAMARFADCEVVEAYAAGSVIKSLGKRGIKKLTIGEGLDKLIADFLSYLDEKVGKGNYLVFLSADHGAMNNARFLQDRRIPAGSWNGDEAADNLNKRLSEVFATDAKLVKEVMNYQVFFNRNIIKENKLDFAKIKQSVVDVLKEDSCVQYACDMEKTMTESIPEDVKMRIVNGYNRERSGDVAIVLKPNYYAHGMKGTDHGEWNPYDTHIPLVFMGWGIQHGATTKQTFMTDIVPTIAALLHVQAPNGCVGQPIF